MKMRCYIVLMIVGASYGAPDILWDQLGRLISQDGDNSDTIERPCPTLELNCIRQYFYKNSQCNPSYGPAPDPFLVQRLEIPLPHANMTLIWNTAQVKGIKDGEVLEFYINKATNILVLEVGYDSIAAVIPNITALYYRKGKEPEERTDMAAITYKSVSLTLTVPMTTEIEMSKAKVYTYIGDSNVPVRIGKGMISSDELQAYEQLMTDLSTGMREASVYQGPLYFAVFLESSICSFRQELSIAKWADQNIDI